MTFYLKSKFMTIFCLFIFSMIHGAFVADTNPTDVDGTDKEMDYEDINMTETDITSGNENQNVTVTDGNLTSVTGENECLTKLDKDGYNLSTGLEIYLKMFETITRDKKVSYSDYDERMQMFEDECINEITVQPDADYTELLICDTAVITRSLDLANGKEWCEMHLNITEIEEEDVSLKRKKGSEYDDTSAPSSMKRRKVQTEAESSVAIEIKSYERRYEIMEDQIEVHPKVKECYEELDNNGFLFKYGLDNYAYRVIEDKGRTEKLTFEKDSLSSIYNDYLTEEIATYEKTNFFENAELWCEINKCEKKLKSMKITIGRYWSQTNADNPLGHLGSHEWCKQNKSYF